jgi:hypothetical protein
VIALPAVLTGNEEGQCEIVVDVGVYPENEVLDHQAFAVPRCLESDSPRLGNVRQVTAVEGECGIPVEVSEGNEVMGGPCSVLEAAEGELPFDRARDLQVRGGEYAAPVAAGKAVRLHSLERRCYLGDAGVFGTERMGHEMESGEGARGARYKGGSGSHEDTKARRHEDVKT